LKRTDPSGLAPPPPSLIGKILKVLGPPIAKYGKPIFGGNLIVSIIVAGGVFFYPPGDDQPLASGLAMVGGVQLAITGIATVTGGGAAAVGGGAAAVGGGAAAVGGGMAVIGGGAIVIGFGGLLIGEYHLSKWFVGTKLGDKLTDGLARGMYNSGLY
jgi:hypothetical protein